MLNRLTVPNIILFAGFLLSQTCLLYHFVDVARLNYSPWVEDAFFYACTLIQVFAFVSYLKLSPLKYYSHTFQFVVLPLFSINFMKQGNFDENFLMNFIRISVFLLAQSLSLIMMAVEYTRYNEDQSESLMKISTNLRVARLLKRIIFVIMVGLRIFMDRKVVSICMLTFSLLEFYLSLTTFTFQNPFHEYLVMVGSLSSLVSWLDFTFYTQGFSSYTYAGEIIFLLITFIEPELFQKALEFKYQVYGQKNIQTQNIHELLGFFSVMKEIILDQHKTFNYTQDFDNKIHVLFQRIIIRSKIQPYEMYQDRTLEDKDFLSGEKVTFLRLLEKRLQQRNQFLINQFYLTTIIRKSLPFKRKALKVFYERQTQKKRASSNIFSRIEMQLLYENMIKRIETNKSYQLHHQTLVFCDHLQELKQKILQLCKHEVGFVNLLQNSLYVPIEKYSSEMIQRYEMKQQIKEKIDNLMKNQRHIHSGDFIYLCLLYKVIFEREQFMINEKMTKNFVIPSAVQNRKNKDELEEKKNVGILVFSGQKKGEIINENETFAKTYGKTVKSGQKSRKCIGQLFPSLKQRIKHQQQLDTEEKDEDVQLKDHYSYECWINRKVMARQYGHGLEKMIISTVQKVKISARIYYEMTQTQSFICAIEPLEDQIGMKVLPHEIQALKKKDIEFEILKTFKVTQLNEPMEICHILIKDYQDSNADSQNSDQISLSNIPENLMLNLNIDTSLSKKMLKIQKEYDKEEIQFNSRRLIILAALLFPLASLLMNIGIFSLQEGEIQKSNDILSTEKTMFEHTILNEKFVGLHLILFQLVDKGTIQPDMCSKFMIPNLKDYAVSNLKKYALNNFDEIQIRQIQGTRGSKDVVKLMSQRFYRFFDLRDPKLDVDYVKYGSLTKSAIFEYASSIGQVTLDNWCKKSIQKVINLSEITKNGLYVNLRRVFQQNFNSLSQVIQYSIVFLVASNSVIFLLIVYLFCRLVNFKYTHIKLLKDFRKPFIQSRIRQMEFILSEISKLDKKQIVDVFVSKSMTIGMVKHGQQKVMDLNEFQKESHMKIIKNGGNSCSSKSISMISSSYMEEETERLLDPKDYSEDDKKQNPLLLVLSFHKHKVIVLFIFFITLSIINVLHSDVIKEKSVKNYQMEDAFNEMSRLFVSMNDLLIGEVIKFQDQETYSTIQQNEMRIGNALEELQSNKFQQKVFDLFPKTMSDFILYSSYCRLAQNRQLCQKTKSKVLNNGLSSIVAFLPADYNSTWNNNLSKNMKKIQETELCEKLVIFLNYTIKMLPQNLIVGYKSIGEELVSKEKQLKIAEFVIYGWIILGIAIMAQVVIGRGRKVRIEALSMDTKHNLYEHAERYRPILNRMYYREEADDIQ